MKKNWPIALLGLILIAIVCVSIYTDSSRQTKKSFAEGTAPIPGTAQSYSAQIGEGVQAAKNTTSWHKLVSWPEGVTALSVIATLFFIAWQALLTRQAVMSAESASQIELRAYLIVNLENGSYQERDKGIRFEGSPTLVNTGKTPAHNDGTGLIQQS